MAPVVSGVFLDDFGAKFWDEEEEEEAANDEAAAEDPVLPGHRDDEQGSHLEQIKGQSYKTFCGRNLRIFVIG